MPTRYLGGRVHLANLNKEDVIKETKKIQKQNQELEQKRAILNEDTLKSKIQSKKPKKEEISHDRRLGYRRKYLTEKYKKFKIIFYVAAVLILIYLMFIIMPCKV